MGNPVLSQNQWQAISAKEGHTAAATMTVTGAVFKTLVLTVVLLGVLGLTWHQIETTETFFGFAPVQALWVSALAGLGIVFAVYFMPRLAGLLGLLYSAAEGVVLGVVTFLAEQFAPGEGLPVLAAGLTGCTLLGMLMLYMTGIIRATPMFVKIVSGALIGLVLMIFGLWITSMFFPWAAEFRSAIYGSGPIGIGFSLFVVGLAAFTLVLDFDFIERGSKSGQPKYMEWVAAVGLLVTLVWLYIEILRLLMKLRR